MPRDFLFEYAVYIGRFQPFHNGHKHVITQGLKYAKKMIILCGSANTEKSEKNPWTFEERKNCIQNSFSSKLNRKITVFPINDYNDDIEWANQIKILIANFSTSNNNIALIGHIKDQSSYYLKLFPQWQFLECKNYKKINATDIRKTLNHQRSAESLKNLKKILPINVISFITKNIR